MKIRAVFIFIISCGVLAALYSYLSGLHLPLLQPAGPLAAHERDMIVFTVLMCALAIVPAYIMLFVFAYRFRADARAAVDTHSPDWDHNSTLLEIAWWGVPALIIAILSVVSWKGTHALDPYEPLPGKALEVQVVALDWKWLFIYPEYNIATLNVLPIPAGVPIHFSLTADAPMNSFWVPQLGGQIMVMPGMNSQLYLQADRPGVFDGYSANLSGRGFADMHFSVHAVPQDMFEEWVALVLEGATPLTQETYSALAEPSRNEPAALYAPVADGLYTAVMNKFMVPATSVGQGSTRTP